MNDFEVKVQSYLSKGLDRTMAEYYAAGRKKIVSVFANDDFTLTLTFDNGEVRLFDCKPILEVGRVFVPFRKLENFKMVYLDDCQCVSWDIDPDVNNDEVWENKVDLCPDCCYVESIPIQAR